MEGVCTLPSPDPGQYLAFEYDRDVTLFVKIFRAEGGRVDCCAESDSSSRSSGSGDEDEDEDEEKSEIGRAHV